jgi:hypothetical protein
MKTIKTITAILIIACITMAFTSKDTANDTSSENAQKDYYFYVNAKIGSGAVYSGFVISNVVSAPLSDRSKIERQFKEAVEAELDYDNINDVDAWYKDTYEEAQKARRAFMARTKRNGKDIVQHSFTYYD